MTTISLEELEKIACEPLTNCVRDIFIYHGKGRPEGPLRHQPLNYIARILCPTIPGFTTAVMQFPETFAVVVQNASPGGALQQTARCYPHKQKQEPNT